MRTLMNDYNNKLLQLKRAEEERLRREKEVQQKKLLEAQQNIINGDTEKAQEQMQEIMNNTTISEKTIEIPKVAGMSTRTIYRIEITDISQIPTIINNVPIVELSKVGKDYLLQQYKVMKSLGKEFTVPGIEIKEEVTTVIR